MTYPYRPTKPTKGVGRGDKKVLVVRVEEELFEDVHKRARRDNCSTSEKMRQLIEWGIQAEDEYETSERRANG
jgi:hypothetical protein